MQLATKSVLEYDGFMKLKLIWSWSKRIFIVGGLLFLLLLVMEFNTRLTKLSQLEAQHALESTDIYQFRLTETYLQTEIAYATSEAAAEEWAREDGIMLETDDHGIALQPDPNFTPVPESTAMVTPEPLSNWDIWVLWFFGDAP